MVSNFKNSLVQSEYSSAHFVSTSFKLNNKIILIPFSLSLYQMVPIYCIHFNAIWVLTNQHYKQYVFNNDKKDVAGRNLKGHQPIAHCRKSEAQICGFQSLFEDFQREISFSQKIESLVKKNERSPIFN